ncbi:glycogen debranching protein [Algoriphagus namhaensis]|uniref:Glycogen debranching protein n=1 Tax=Algoriphagus namhaensis TaxID=915353 RepID=A0ABV8ATF9_9BACT
MNKNIYLLICLLTFACGPIQNPEYLIFEDLSDQEEFKGKAEYLASPYVTAGDRFYMVGHQDGTFPDLGWHVEGEMGGLWMHPIKLMDGFTASLGTAEETVCLDKAEAFYNYPFANKHEFGNLLIGIQVDRVQFVSDGKEGIIVLFRFENQSEQVQNFDFYFEANVDLRPVWLGEKSGMIDSPDQVTFEAMTGTFTAKDSENDWFAVWGSSADFELEEARPSCTVESAGEFGVKSGFSTGLTLESGETKVLPIFIAGSDRSELKALETLASLKANYVEDWFDKKARYEELFALSKITIPDAALQKAYEWTKYNTDWLIRDVPGVGRGFGAGLPDYPWWFGVDSEYTIQGLIATGRKDLVYETLDLLSELSELENGNGRIVHEVSTNAVVFNPGNINETPQFASTVWEVYRWTGDRALLEKYFPLIEKGLNWLLEENDQDGNLLADGYGMMEIHGLESEMIDVAVYSYKAFADAAQMAEILGKSELAQSYQQTANTLAETINTDFWVPEFGSYADFIGTTEEALHLIEGAIIRADTLNKPWAVEELRATQAKLSTLPKDQKQGIVLYHNWVVNTPMEVGVADPEKAKIALETGRKYTNPFGVFVTGIDRDELAENEDGTFKGSQIFSYTGAVMTLPTGVQAIGENKYGNPDAALDYLKRMTRSFGFAMPGSIYEVSPDYGMFTQAWNLYSFAVPIVMQFFGIQPDAANRVIYIRPQMPSDWEEAKIEKVKIGDNEISMTFERDGDAIAIEISQTEKKWGISVEIPEDFDKRVKLLGKEVNVDTQNGYRRFLMSGAKVRVEASKN